MHRPHSITRALMVAAAAAGLLAAVSASPASASVPAPSATSPPAAAAAAIVPSTVQYITKDFFGGEGQKVLRTVACPTGTFVVSSGAGDGILKSIAPLRSLNAPQKLANFTAVGVTAVLSNPFFPPGRLRIVVGCAPASQLANATTQTKVLSPGPPFSQRRAEVRCPLLANGTPTHAFGGGGHFLTIDGHYSTAPDFMHTNTVTADGRGWVYQGATSSRNEKLIVTTQCAPMPDSRVVSSSITAPFGTLADPLAVCKSGFTDISGGVESDPRDSDGRVLHSMTAFFGGWFVRSNPFGTRVTARAQCVPNV